jgi:ABC-type multidrug transport system fused ATPase/permease subunit
LLDFSVGQVGLALSQVFFLSGRLQGAMRHWTDLENQMTSVERGLEYAEVKHENTQGLKLEDWPKLGGVKYENIFLSYTNSNEPVLKNVSFVVKPREKIGIVGRTGAGKSSILSTRLRHCRCSFSGQEFRSSPRIRYSFRVQFARMSIQLVCTRTKIFGEFWRKLV